MIDDDDAPVEPCVDSWRAAGADACWVLRPSRQPESPSQINRWCAGALETALRAFEGVARAWSIEYDYAAADGPRHEAVRAEPGEGAAQLAERAWRRLAALDGTVSGACARLDLLAWVRTRPDGVPVRVWLRLPARLDVFIDDEECWLALSFGHTLFAFDPGQSDEAQRTLHRMNRPLLAQALARWVASGGEISETSGGATRDGYELH